MIKLHKLETLLVAPGLTTRTRTLLGAKGIATRSKDATDARWDHITASFASLGWKHTLSLATCSTVPGTLLGHKIVQFTLVSVCVYCICTSLY